METKKFVLLDIDYITQKGEAVIRLFGRQIGENNGTITAHHKTFKPYIYIQTDNQKTCENQLSKLNLSNIETVTKEDNGKTRDFLKLTLKHPHDTHKLKKELKNMESVGEIREYDIPFYRRYLVDNGLNPMNILEVHGKTMKTLDNGRCIFEIQEEPIGMGLYPGKLKLLSFNIEAATSHGTPNVQEDPIILASFSSNHGLQRIITNQKSSQKFVETVSTEEELIQRFIETVNTEDPDILLGYNSDRYDFPYLTGRAEKLNIPLKLGVDGSKLKIRNNGRRNAATIRGRVHIDLYSNLRRHLPLEHHTLKRVYKELFGADKEDIPDHEVYTSFHEGGKRLETLFKYVLADVEAVTKIGEKMLPLSIELTRIVGQPLFDVSRMGSGKQVEWYLIRKAHETGRLAPNKFGNYIRDVVGGYVEEPVQGLQKNIHYFDFRSLYPSIIVAKNISPDTLTENQDSHVTPEFGYKFKKAPQGFIPSVVVELLENRRKVKKIMAQTTDTRELQILNFRQEAFKRLTNTIYGLYNHSTFRWYSIECSEAITAWGRDFLQKTMEKSREHGFKPLYADTDGFYAVLDEIKE